ncbi:hypothetical protein JTJ32_16825 [Pseudomonas sp. 20GA0068]|uniref:Uncharacterized protein n=1 Tax=Pseudomonas alliivorans TaxID=2810613 RepID=A0ABS4C8H4_9PSED|nr:hypothetical protein [Pseudomonas alliivorans]
MPKLKADLSSRLLIKVAVNAIALAAIDGGGVARELCITFAGIGRSQLMESLQPLLL